MTPTIAKVPGIARTSPAFRAGLYQLGQRHGWNVDAIAAVISSESGFDASARNSQPGQTATGLLQWIDSTSRRIFNMPSSAIANLSAEQQLPLVEKWFKTTLGDGLFRPVDYYLVGWGARPGLSDDYVLATKGQRTYELNKALDVDSNDRITVSDLRRKVENVLASAGGERVGAAPFPGSPPAGASRSSSVVLVGQSTSLLRTCENVSGLTTLRLTSEGPDVVYLRALLGLSLSFRFDDECANRVREYQLERRLTPDSIVGPKTWGALKQSVGGSP